MNERLKNDDPAAIYEYMRQGHILTQLLLIAEKIDLRRILSGGPKTCNEIAAETGLDGDRLFRFLRAFTAFGIIGLAENNEYEATPILDMIAHDSGIFLSQENYRIWENAWHSLETGESAHSITFGCEPYDYLNTHPEKSEKFDEWNHETNTRVLDLLDIFDFGRFRTVVDLGGGKGLFLCSLLKQYPSMAGILSERPLTANLAAAYFASQGLSRRCRIVPGDFFEAVPPGGDAYLLVRILLNFSDDQVMTILNNCHAVMGKRSRLLIIDFFFPPPSHPDYKYKIINDLECLVRGGGAYRTEVEWNALLAKSPFEIAGIHRPAETSLAGIIEAVPA